MADQELLEKDVRLHLLLRSLVQEPRFGPYLVFKGGTCLIKCYLDYPRFSADLDFTWHAPGQGEAPPQGTKEFRRAVRPEQRDLERWFRGWAIGQGYTPADPRFVRLGRSNRMMSVSLQYPSSSSSTGIVKVQVSFGEVLLYPVVRAEARSLVRGPLPRAFDLVDGGLAGAYATPVPVAAYDPREILAEKCRAILTRTAAKSRDLVDLFLLEKDLHLRVEDYVEVILAKTRVGGPELDEVPGPGEDLQEREALLEEEDVGPLLLRPLDEAAFRPYRIRVLTVLRGLVDQVLLPP